MTQFMNWKPYVLPESYHTRQAEDGWRIEADYADGLRIVVCLIPHLFPQAKVRAEALTETLNDFGEKVDRSLSDLATFLAVERKHIASRQ